MAKKRSGTAPVRAPRRGGGWVFFGVIGAVAAAVIALSVWQSLGSQGGIEGVQSYEDLSREHVTSNVNYPQSPPVGGRHDAAWAECTGTVYDEPVPEENAVHSLEHGAVWVTYRPGMPEDQRQQLRDLVSGTDYRMLSPYPDQPSAVMATAWGKQLELDSADDPRLESFLDAYTLGPQTPEQGATCAGGGVMQ